MLIHLQLQNIALADQLDIDFGTGLSVITGETGAGKSVLIRALKLLLGERAQSHVIKHGQARGVISANFDVRHLSAAKAWLTERAYDNDDDCLLRRILTQDGKSKAYINGNACTLAELKTLGQYLISIHGQHDGQQLLDEKHQRDLLDLYGQHGQLAKDVKTAFSNWQNAKQRYDTLKAQAKNSATQAEFLRFQIEELQQVNLNQDVIKALDQEQKMLANADLFLSNGQTICEALQGNDGASNKLHHALQLLKKIEIKNKNNLIEALTQAHIQIDESAHDIDHAINDFEADPSRLQTVEFELSRLHDLARKHHCKADELANLLTTFETELAAIDNSDETLKMLEKTIHAAEKTYTDKAKKLSQARKKTAKKLSDEITKRVRTLGMPKATFNVTCDAIEPASYGLEKVRFKVNLNPGSQEEALNKIASGGELSRISLCIHVATSHQAQTPTLIFDEVDTGISGDVANKVGELLKTLAHHAQIICITHLAQVAAKGQHHLFVKKHSDDTNTVTQIEPLNREARIAELAHMTSGNREDQTAKQLAERLLDEIV